MVVTEADVGVTRFINEDCPGFYGSIKHRFRDFLVNEIALDGQVCHLTDESAPKIAPPVMAEDAQAAATPLDPVEARKAGVDALSKEINAQVSSSIDGLLTRIDNNDKEEAEAEPLHVLLPPIEDKAIRSKLHQVVRQHFGSLLMTDTVLVDTVGGEMKITKRDGPMTQRVVRVIHSAKSAKPGDKRKAGNDARGRGKKAKLKHAIDKRNFKTRAEWTAPEDYVKFLMYKENMDNHEALSQLRTRMNIAKESLAIAGTKDKRGITVQQVTVYRVEPERIAEAAKQLRNKRGRPAVLHVGNFTFVKDRLRMGDLRGNRFTVLFRDVRLEDDQEGNAGAIPGDDTEAKVAAKMAISNKIKAWGETGFLNYFGMQRFGTSDIPTHKLGIAALKSDWRELLCQILQPREVDDDRVREGIQVLLKTGHSKQLMECIPSDHVAMRAVAIELGKRAKKLMAEKETSEVALEELSKEDLRAIFDAVPYTLRTLYVNAYQSYLFNVLLSERVERYGATVPVPGDLVLKSGTAGSDRAKAKADQVELATEEDIAAGKWTIEDVVLPLIGPSLTTYPSHALSKEYCASLLEKDGVDLMTNDTSNNLFPAGTYRHIVIKPTDVKHKWVWYGEDQPDGDFIPTDLDKVQNTATTASTGTCRAALCVEFTLEAAAYATMGFRELMKQSTDRISLVNSSFRTESSAKA